MPFASGRELKEDVLFRAGESLTVSSWNVRALDYLNRVYRSLCAGASEYLPEFVDDWWWMRSKTTLILEPALEGDVTVTKGSANITFGAAPADSLAGWRIRMEGGPDVFVVLTHVAAAAAAVLDTEFTGDTGTRRYTAMKVDYALSSAVSSLVSPMISYRERGQIIGMTPERMDMLFPLSRLSAGAPMAFALEDSQLVRFSHGGLLNDRSMRIEYRYKPIVADITDSLASLPLVPIEYRHLLSDMALTYLFMDKNDDRAAASSAAAKSGLIAMVRENRRRMAKMDNTIGKIMPRGGDHRGPLRTESGLIIG